MNATNLHRNDLVIVDENLADYDRFAVEIDRHVVRVSLFASGEAALRAAGVDSSARWVVNIHLPDMSGIFFMTLIRRRLRRTSVLLVGDRYSAEDELAARLAGATAYVCKPATVDWLVGYPPRCRSPAIRAGPVFSEMQEYT